MGVNGTARNLDATHKGSHLKTLSKWAHGKQYSSLQSKKEEQEVQRFKKAAALRKYAKLCKAEGIESARVNVDTKTNANPEFKAKSEISSLKGSERKAAKVHGDHKGKHYQPFEKEIRLAGENERVKIVSDERRIVKQAEIKAKQVKREANRKMHMKRTKRGQPVLDNRVKDLLSKIEKNMAK